MPKVHFFKLAQELGERPVELQKKLERGGIPIRSTSTMLDEETAVKIREFLRQVNASAPAPAEAPVATLAPDVDVSTPAEAVPTAAAPSEAAPAEAAPPAPAEEPREAPRAEEPRPVTRIIKRIPGVDGQPTTQRSVAPPAQRSSEPRGEGGPPKAKKPRPGGLLFSDGELSPDAEFGIVKAAGVVPLPPPRAPRPVRPDGEQRPFAPGGQRPEGPRGPRPEGGPRPPRRDAGGPPTAPAAPPDAARGGAAKGPARGPADAKKKQKRTIFTDKDKERGRTPARSLDLKSTTLRSRRKRRGEGARAAAAAAPVIEEPIIITSAITVGDLADRVLAPPAQVISQLITMGVLATVNQQIEPEQAVSVLEKLGFEALYQSEMQELASWRLTATTGNGEMAGIHRPPVVTILGHVDHGKTTLLDSIRKTAVTEQEFGGITQHIGAYQAVIKDQKITFLDTPGHAAFTAMRARGANLTDIAVLVVAADDGIQPQTIEAIDHAKAAKVPIIVAINKVDLPSAQPDVVKQQLTAYGLVSEEWGGDTIMVPLSAKKGTGIDQLLEMILLVAEVQELRAVADKPGCGAVVESRLDKQRGPLATVLVQEGTLRVGDALVIGMVSGKIRAMADDKGRAIKEAGPSTPVEIIGISDAPYAGDLFAVIESEKQARDIAERRRMEAREAHLQSKVSLQNLSSMVASGQVQDLNIIVKTDVAGSIEAISHALSLEHAEIRVNIIHGGVGDVTESDVLLASASQAIIVGFHVRIEPQARLIAEEAGIDVRVYQVIYDLVDDVTKAMVGMLHPVYEEAVLGHAEVRAIFKISRLGTIAGCYVVDGLVRRGSKMRVKRNGEVVLTGELSNLKHLKDDVREMAQGFECGISTPSYNDWKEGDIIESYVIKELRRETL